MDLILLTTILAFILYSSVLVLLFIQKPRKVYFLHGIFIAFIFSFILWTIFNYVSVTSTNPDTFIWLVRCHMTTVILQGIFFDLFVTNHPFKGNVISRKKVVFLSIIFILALIVTWTPTLFESSAWEGDQLIPVPGFAPFSFPFLMILLYLDTTFALVRKVSSPVNRKQAKYLEFAHLLFFVLGFGLLFIPVVLFHTRIFQPYGALFTFPIALISLFSLLKLRLLDKQYFVSAENVPSIIENRIKKFWGDPSTRGKWDVGQVLFPPHKKFLKLVEQEVLGVLAEEGDNDLHGMMIAYSPEANENYLIRSFGSLGRKKFEEVGTEYMKMEFSIVKKNDLMIIIDLGGQASFSSSLDQKLKEMLPYKVLSLLSKPVL